MNNEQYLLGKLAEEAAELSQIALKAQQFGINEVYTDQNEPLTNGQRIEKEFNDILAVVGLLNLEVVAGIKVQPQQLTEKLDKLTYWRLFASRLEKVKL